MHPAWRSKPVFSWLLVVLVLLMLLRDLVWSPVLILGNSMSPNLRGGQFVGLNKLAYHHRPPGRGEIVAVWTGRELLIKRIIALPGEDVCARNGKFYINGTALPEPYVQYRDHSSLASGRLAPGHFVIAGDNRRQTVIAIVKAERIVGRILP